MSIGLIGPAVVLFAVTNIDDIIVLALFFSQATARRGVIRVVIGQYLGFAAILATAVVGALVAGLLPEMAIPYLGLLPLGLGLRAAWKAWREHRTADSQGHDGESEAQHDKSPARQPAVGTVAAVTFANGGDNIGVYVPVFATFGAGGLVTYVMVFVALVAVWCAAGHFFASRPIVARAISRWGHIILPVVLIGIGTVILVGGAAFGI